MYIAEVEVSLRRGRCVRASRKFKSKRVAYCWVRVAAWWVDFITPTKFAYKGRDGNIAYQSTSLDIDWVVRPVE